jgi:hypothetical protein
LSRVRNVGEKLFCGELEAADTRGMGGGWDAMSRKVLAA